MTQRPDPSVPGKPGASDAGGRVPAAVGRSGIPAALGVTGRVLLTVVGAWLLWRAVAVGLRTVGGGLDPVLGAAMAAGLLAAGALAVLAASTPGRHHGRGGRRRHLLGSALRWGGAVGGAAFAVGFAASLVAERVSGWSPLPGSAPVGGPLLAVLVAAPLGFAVGATVGLVRGWWAGRRT